MMWLCFNDMPWWIWLFVFAFGTVWGSFFNCLIYRIPRHIRFGLSRSFCPACRHSIAFYDNIPLISFLVLGRKCRDCGASISWQYPLVEFITGLWFCALTWWVGSLCIWGWPLVGRVLLALYFLFLVPITVIDFRHQIIPDRFSYPGIIMGVAFSFAPGGLTPGQSLLGVAAGVLPLVGIAYVGKFLFAKEEAMGGGDIKIMAAFGSLLGPKTVLLSLFFGAILGSSAGIPILIKKGVKGDTRIAFGPFLGAGVVIAFFFGERIVTAYQGLFDKLLLN